MVTFLENTADEMEGDEIRRLPTKHGKGDDEL